MRIVAMIMCALTILAGEQATADSSLFAPYQKDAFPDIGFLGGQLTYVAGSGPGQLSIVSTGSGIISSPPLIPGLTPLGGSPKFTLNATIPHSPAFDGSQPSVTGTLQIDGTVAPSFTSGNLLTGTLFAFRADRVAGTMEFLFNMMGGDAANLFGAMNNGVGIVVVSGVNFPSQTFDFTTDFSDNRVNVDTASTSAVVPEPASFLLAMFGVVGVIGGARLRRKHRLQA